MEIALRATITFAFLLLLTLAAFSAASDEIDGCGGFVEVFLVLLAKLQFRLGLA